MILLLYVQQQYFCFSKVQVGGLKAEDSHHYTASTVPCKAVSDCHFLHSQNKAY